MREIMFKAKLWHNNEWVYGNLIIANNGQPYIIPSEFIEPDGHHLRIESDSAWWVNPKTICRLTGLKDKKGVDVYEGDIVICKGASEPEEKGFICKFQNYMFEFVNVNYPNNPEYSIYHEFYDYIGSHTEVVGNIHDK